MPIEHRPTASAFAEPGLSAMYGRLIHAFLVRENLRSVVPPDLATLLSPRRSLPLPKSEVMRLCDFLGSLHAHPLLGFQLGCGATLSHHAEFGLYVASSEHVGDAVDSILDGIRIYDRLANFAKITHRDGIELRLAEVQPGWAGSTFYEAVMASGLTNMVSELSGRTSLPLKIHLRQRAPHSALSALLCHSEVHFGAENFEIHIPHTVLNWGCIAADALLHAKLKRQLIQQQSLSLQKDVITRVQEAIASIGLQHVDRAAVACALAVSVRTLDRQLQGEGTSFRDVYTEYRQAQVIYLLKHTKLKLKEVAEMVGITGAANLARMTRKATGFTPTQLRHAT